VTAIPNRRPLTREAELALAPVRAWLRDAARREADAMVASARADADQQLARARAEAAELISFERDQGAAEGAAAAARERARARREARTTVLRAQAALVTLLRDQARAAVLSLKDDEVDYAALREELESRARTALGPEATVAEAPAGGVVAQAGSRRVDLSLAMLADQAVSGLGVEVTRLWT
jgi:vacuolar-type H+-ATPase subunit E/Vma4